MPISSSKSKRRNNGQNPLPQILIAIAAVLVLVGVIYFFSQPAPPMPGSDRDVHGCIPSAGYSWCEEKQKCLRVWEENCTATPVIVGGDRDAHGCIGSAGYTWCEELNKCLRVWEEACKPAGAQRGAVMDVANLCSYLNGTVADAGACPNGTDNVAVPSSDGKSKACCYPAGTPLPMYGAGVDSHGCVGSTGYIWCEAKQRCLNILIENCTSAT